MAAIERETAAMERETAAIAREMAATDSDRARFGTGTTRDRRDVALRSTRVEIDRDARSAWSVWSVWSVPPLCTPGSARARGVLVVRHVGVAGVLVLRHEGVASHKRSE